MLIRNECHRITTDLVRRFGLIVLENLPVRNMVRTAKGSAEEPGKNMPATRRLNREILSQSCSMIAGRLVYKADWAGRQVAWPDPRYTSQTCSGGGMIRSDSRKGEA